MDNGDMKTANAIMKIIARTMIKDKENNTFSSNIVITDKKEEKYFKSFLEEQEKQKENSIEEK